MLDTLIIALTAIGVVLMSIMTVKNYRDAKKNPPTKRLGDSEF